MDVIQADNNWSAATIDCPFLISKFLVKRTISLRNHLRVIYGEFTRASTGHIKETGRNSELKMRLLVHGIADSGEIHSTEGSESAWTLLACFPQYEELQEGSLNLRPALSGAWSWRITLCAFEEIRWVQNWLIFMKFERSVAFVSNQGLRTPGLHLVFWSSLGLVVTYYPGMWCRMGKQSLFERRWKFGLLIFQPIPRTHKFWSRWASIWIQASSVVISLGNPL